MSFLNWFTKSPPPALIPPESSGLGHVDATVPMNATVKSRTGALAMGNAANRKTERLERRELLYSVVREAMTRAGVLSASYKFKVLSLDSRGRQYLIMMDLARQHAGDSTRLAELEGLIAKSAKSRFDIVVTAVYWRVNEHVTAGLTRRAALSAAPAVAEPTVPAVGAAGMPPPTSVTPAKPRFEPLQPDEVLAFKQAVAAKPDPLSAHSIAGEVVRSGRRNPAPEPIFEDTQIDENLPTLSGTQYGDLN